MRRLGNVVLDVNVVVSLIIRKKFAHLLRAVAFGRITVFACAELFDELSDVLARPHLARYLTIEPASYLKLLKDAAVVEPIREAFIGSPDPDDDYLVALSIQQRAWLVSGDGPLMRWKEPPRGLKRMTYTEFQKRVL